MFIYYNQRVIQVYNPTLEKENFLKESVVHFSKEVGDLTETKPD